MAAFREQVKDIIAAFTHFVEDTLAKEKLSSKAEDERNKLKKLLDNIKEEYPALKTSSDWAKDSQSTTNGSTPNLYDSAARSNALSGNELINQAKISGFLKKKSDGLMGKPKKKWCGIKDDTFYIYDKSSDKKQKGQIELIGASVRKFDGGKKNPPFGFEVNCPNTGIHVFFASNETEMNSWLRALGVKTEKALPPPPANNDDDDMELYEEFDHAPEHNITPMMAQSRPQPTVPNNNSDDDDDIYEDEFQPSKPNMPPLPTPPTKASPPDEIYDDMADMEENYDDVEQIIPAAAAAAARPPPVQSKVEPPKPVSAAKKALPEPPGLNYENLYYALWSREGDQPDELSFRQAEIMLVKNKIFDRFSWWAAELNGKVGYVPKNFLTPVYVPVK